MYVVVSRDTQTAQSRCCFPLELAQSVWECQNISKYFGGLSSSSSIWRYISQVRINQQRKKRYSVQLVYMYAVQYSIEYLVYKVFVLHGLSWAKNLFLVFPYFYIYGIYPSLTILLFYPPPSPFNTSPQDYCVIPDLVGPVNLNDHKILLT